MGNFNKVFLMGNLTKDPEIRHTQNGTSVCNLSLAVNRKYKKNEEWKEEVLFVDIIVFGKVGENCDKFLKKGSNVFVTGRLQQRSWKDKEGNKKSKMEVVAEEVQFLRTGKEEKKNNDDLPF